MIITKASVSLVFNAAIFGDYLGLVFALLPLKDGFRLKAQSMRERLF